jgi:hypothetical protein
VCVLAPFAALKAVMVALLAGKVDDVTDGFVCALVDFSVVYESSAFDFWPIVFNSVATGVFGPVVEPLPTFAASQVAYFTRDAVATAVFKGFVDDGVVESLPTFAAPQVAYFTCDAVATAVFRVSVDDRTGGDKVAPACASVLRHTPSSHSCAFVLAPEMQVPCTLPKRIFVIHPHRPTHSLPHRIVLQRSTANVVVS